MIHFDRGVHALAYPEFEHARRARTRHRIAVQRDDVKRVSRQMQLNVLRCACIQDMKKDTLPLLYLERPAMAQGFSIDRVHRILDLHGSLLHFVLIFLGAVILRFHRQAALPFVRGEKDLLIIAARISLGLHVDEQTHRYRRHATDRSWSWRGVYIARPGLDRNNLVLNAAACGNCKTALFLRAIQLSVDLNPCQ